MITLIFRLTTKDNDDILESTFIRIGKNGNGVMKWVSAEFAFINYVSNNKSEKMGCFLIIISIGLVHKFVVVLITLYLTNLNGAFCINTADGCATNLWTNPIILKD